MEKLNVAIADDNVRMADILGQMIEEDKDLTLVGKAHNGEEICSIIREKEPDVVVLDIIMPKMDGRTVLEHCRQFSKETAGFYCSIGGGTGKNHRRCVQSWRILLYAETF